MDILKNAYEITKAKITSNIKIIGEDLREVYSRDDGNYFNAPKEKCPEMYNVYVWMTSFFTGMAGIAYQTDKDDDLLKWLYSVEEKYSDKVYKTPMDTMHDLGFLYSPYSVMMYKMTGDKKMRDLSIIAADVLAKRFIPQGKYIRAWGRMDDKLPWYASPEQAEDNFYKVGRSIAIIDCMMNLPLLFWAWQETGNTFYRDVAMLHADTTMKLFIRDDGSVCHAYKFDSVTGEPTGEANYCGYGVGSHWGRGAAWAIYGFALAYTYSGKAEYLQTAIKISEKFVDCCTEEDGIPVWDFRLPKDKPAQYIAKPKTMDWDVTDNENKKYNRDTSAAAIAICGFMEILSHIQNNKLQKHIDLMLNSLCDKYIDSDLSVQGILKCSNGGMVYTQFGDYFFMEALARKIYGVKAPW